MKSTVSLQATGVLFTLIGAVLWGGMGTGSEFVQHNRSMSVEFLISCRLLLGGSLLVLYMFLKEPTTMLSLLRNRFDLWEVGVFGVLGVALCQYSYSRAIFYAGAGVATVLQYLAPVLIIFYMFIVHHKKPNRMEVIGVVVAIVGLLCIVFKSGLNLEGIDERVIFWGLLSAVGVSIYTVYPVRLLEKYGTLPVVGLGMLIGGMLFTPIFTPFEISGVWDQTTFLVMGYIIVLGTVIAFSSYLEGVRIIGAVQGSVLSSLEPVAAAFFSWIILGTSFAFLELVGFTLIISTIFILAMAKE